MFETTEAYGLTFRFPAGDLAVGACLRDYGEFSRVGVKLAVERSRGRDFLDVGANIGAFALPVSRFARQVVAIEAHPGLANLLGENVALNRCENIEIVAAAAGAAVGTLAFPAPDLSERRNFGSTGVGRTSAPKVTVPIVRLDDVAPSDTALVKIDVEGFELEVLRGAERLLNERKASWLVEFSEPSILEILGQAGYLTYWFWDPFVTPGAPKARWRGKLLGDLSVFAVPANDPQPVGMVAARAGERAPTATKGFEYLRAFGMSPKDS